MAAFSPSGVITLTTDFGHKGPFVGTMRGVMLTRDPTAKIVDLTHEIVVHWPAEAGFWLARSYHWFPGGSVHVAVVDPGVGTERDVIVVIRDGHAFVAPDNGLLAGLVDEHSTVYRLDEEGRKRFALEERSATFHGRDIFAPIGAELAIGRHQPSEVGPVVTDIIPSWVDDPTVSPGKVEGVVISVDNFGNLISNIDAHLLEPFQNPVVHSGTHSFPFCRTYGEMKPGEFLALINSVDVVEIAQSEKNASETLGLERGAPIIVTEHA